MGAAALRCDAEAVRLVLLEPEGNIGALLVDCRLDWDWFLCLSEVEGCQISYDFCVDVFEPNMLLRNLFFFLYDSFDSLDSCLVIGIEGARELFVFGNIDGARDEGVMRMDSSEVLRDGWRGTRGGTAVETGTRVETGACFESGRG
jgi:hypothetical protein